MGFHSSARASFIKSVFFIGNGWAVPTLLCLKCTLAMVFGLTIDMGMRLFAPPFSRPCGTCLLGWARKPSDESLGYCQPSLCEEQPPSTAGGGPSVSTEEVAFTIAGK